MKIFTEKNIGKLIILNSSLVGLLMWLGIVAHTFWDSEVNLKMELAHLEKERVDAKKKSVAESVDELIQSIEVRRQMSMNKLHHNLESQVLQIHAMMTHLYNKNKDRMKPAELEQLLVEAVRPFKFSSGQSWFFIRSLNGITKLWPPEPDLEGHSIYENSNENKVHVFSDMSEIAQRGGGFYEYFWPKPADKQKKLYQAAAYLTAFKPFNWYVGTAEYLDELEQDTQLQFQSAVSRHAGRTENEYLQIIDLSSIGKIIDAGSPLSKLLRSGYQDPEAKRIRESLLSGLKNGGEIFVKYQDKKQGTNEIVYKMTYFRLYDKWNWLIAAGFDYSDLEELIQLKKKEHQRMFQEKLRISLAIFCFILLGALCISLLFAHKVRLLFLSYRQRLEASNKELLKAMDDAKSATMAKSEFLANMSHEIRTPMHGIIGLAELMLETTLSERQADYMRKILFSSRSLEEIINDILDFSRIEAGMLKIEQVPFNLPDLFDKLMLMFSEHSRRKHIHLSLSLSPDVPQQVIGDPMRLHQVLSNLIGNAIKFTDTGEITVRVATIRRNDDQAEINFSVRDTGIGIPAEKIAQLFESFTQADNSTARKYGGTGLGLTISKRLVNLMGGDLSVESEFGVGSTFSCSLVFFLPVQQSHSGSDTGDITASSLQRIRNARILLVEDNLINQQVAQEILAKAELQVKTVNNGADAVAAVAEEDFDAVLMDIQMPIMDGYEATQKIRQDLGKTELPILAMTAHAVSEERDRCFRMGMDDHIAKPVSRAALFQALAKWIRLHPEAKKKTPSIGCGTACLGALFIDEENANQPNSVELDLAGGIKRLEGNKTLYVKLLKSFCQEQEDIEERLGALSEKNDLESLRYAIHSIKGVAGNIGLLGIQRIAAKTEKELQDGWTGTGKRSLLQLIQQVRETIDYLSARLYTEEKNLHEDESEKIPEDFDKEKALVTLEQLASLLEQSDFSSLQFLEDHKKILKYLMSGQHFARLLHYIEGFSFEQALAMIKSRLAERGETGRA
jgi:signal transduction histidine kinase/FixJ family two-component response regulator/HPt (histidine-containing phosphotransfer) domain-containing protein